MNLYELEAEEDERFEWWLEANVPEIEKQAAEIEGGEFEEIGEKWISDGTGGNVNDVRWAGKGPRVGASSVLLYRGLVLGMFPPILAVLN